MENTAGFRDKLYKNYFKNQVSRTVDNIKDKLAADNLQLKNEIIPLLPDDKDVNILELGCGYGGLLLLLQQSGYKNCEGIDHSEDQVKAAGELGSINVRQADMIAFLELANNDFDVIIGIDVIEHSNKPELFELLEKSKKALRDNGTLIFRTPNADAPFGSTYCFGDLTHEIFLNYSSAEQVFLSTGFEQISIFPSYIRVNGYLKNLMRRFLWFIVVVKSKVILFASGKSTKTVILTPNLLIKCKVRK